MLAVLFSNKGFEHSAGADQAFAALTYWGVPFGVSGTREGTEVCEKFPPHTIWIVCDASEAAISAQRNGHPVIFVGSSPPFEISKTAIAIASLYDFPNAVRPFYTRAALTLRDVIASEFEST